MGGKDRVGQRVRLLPLDAGAEHRRQQDALGDRGRQEWQQRIAAVDPRIVVEDAWELWGPSQTKPKLADVLRSVRSLLAPATVLTARSIPRVW